MAQLRFRAVVAAAALAAVGTGCASTPSVRVNTTVAPEAQFGSYHTFNILSPRPRDVNPASGDDPMVDNSITNRALRDDLRQALVAKGYAPGGPQADFSVAYYAAARKALDVSTVDYGYPYRRWWGPREEQEVRQVNQGTVVIDVIDRRTNRLVWRGTGRTEVSDDQNRYTAQ
ncbi:MAG TPA: DUF4136 domain-containing protein, partial [Gemmatirosa sp.]